MTQYANTKFIQSSLEHDYNGELSDPLCHCVNRGLTARSQIDALQTV